MRKCIFKKFLRNEEFQTPGMTKFVPVYVDSEPGLFHGWGVEYEEFETGPGNYSVGIIEMPDGTIETPLAKMVRFLEGG